LRTWHGIKTKKLTAPQNNIWIISDKNDFFNDMAISMFFCCFGILKINRLDINFTVEDN
jgi:hypothetical protein